MGVGVEATSAGNARRAIFYFYSLFSKSCGSRNGFLIRKWDFMTITDRTGVDDGESAGVSLIMMNWYWYARSIHTIGGKHNGRFTYTHDRCL